MWRADRGYDPNSKLNACVDNVFRIWQDGTPDKLTQLLFCDMTVAGASSSIDSSALRLCAANSKKFLICGT